MSVEPHPRLVAKAMRLPSGDQTGDSSADDRSREPRGDAVGELHEPDLATSRVQIHEVESHALVVGRESEADEEPGSSDGAQGLTPSIGPGELPQARWSLRRRPGRPCPKR